MNGLRPGAIIRLALLCLCTFALLPFQFAIVRFAPAYGSLIPKRFHRLALLCLGVRRRSTGTPPPAGAGGLIVSNHVSWLDISVIGAERTLSFVAKTEVAAWPVIGLLSKLQRTVFIDRMRRSATAEVADEMGQRISDGELVVLFAEGTTGDGTRILPLRSSLLGAAHAALGNSGGGDVMIFPLTVTYTGFHGIAGGRAERAALAWYGDTELAPHLREVLNSGAVDVELAWGSPIRMGRETSRKEATRLAETAIREARREAISGRRPVQEAIPSDLAQ